MIDLALVLDSLRARGWVPWRGGISCGGLVWDVRVLGWVVVGSDSVKNYVRDPAMPYHRCALSRLLRGLCDGPWLVREELFRGVFQADWHDLIEAEAAGKIGAGGDGRSEQPRTRGSGTGSKTLATLAGQLELAFPTLWEGSFFLWLLHPPRRVGKAFPSRICTTWIEGISTRKVDRLVKAIGKESGVPEVECFADLRRHRRGRPPPRPLTRPIDADLLEQHQQQRYREHRYLSSISIRHLTHQLHQDPTPTALPILENTTQGNSTLYHRKMFYSLNGVKPESLPCKA